MDVYLLDRGLTEVPMEVLTIVSCLLYVVNWIYLHLVVVR